MRVLLLVVAAVPEIRVRTVYPHDYLVVTETPSFGGADIFLSSHILFKHDTELPFPYAYIAGKGSAHISRTGQESVRSSRDIGLEPGLLVFDVVFFFVVIKVLREKQDVYPFSGGAYFGIGVHGTDYILRRFVRFSVLSDTVIDIQPGYPVEYAYPDPVVVRRFRNCVSVFGKRVFIIAARALSGNGIIRDFSEAAASVFIIPDAKKAFLLQFVRETVVCHLCFLLKVFDSR